MLVYFFKALRENKGAFIFYLVLLIAMQAISLIYPLYINYVLVNRAQLEVWMIVVLVGMLAGLPILQALRDRMLNKTCNLFSVSTSQILYGELMHKDLASIKHYTTPYIDRAVSNYAFLSVSFYLYNVIDTLASLLLMIGIALIMIKVSVLLAIYMFGLELLRLFMVYLVNRRFQAINVEKREAENHYLSAINQFVEKTIVVVTRQKQISSFKAIRKLGVTYEASQHKYATVQSRNQLMKSPLDWTIQLVCVMGSLFLGKSLYITQLAYSYTDRLNEAMLSFLEIGPTYAMMKANYEIITKLLDLPNVAQVGLRDSFERVEVCQLGFHYENQPSLFENLNLTLIKGKPYALVGTNGSGKSTLTRLLTGMYTPTSGKIQLDGQNLTSYDLEYYQNNCVSVFSQDDFLFEGGLEENIFGSLKQIETMKQILHLPDLNSRSTLKQLSGGEKRKILFARFLVEVQCKQPSLIIMDEPEYALDVETVAFVRKQITELAKKHIVVVVMHTNDIDDRLYQIIHLKAAN